MLRDELSRFGVTTLPRPNKPSTPLALSHINSILRNRYYVGVVVFDGVEYPGRHPRLISEACMTQCSVCGKREFKAGRNRACTATI